MIIRMFFILMDGNMGNIFFDLKKIIGSKGIIKLVYYIGCFDLLIFNNISFVYILFLFN